MKTKTAIGKSYEKALTSIPKEKKTLASSENKIVVDVVIVDCACIAHAVAHLFGSRLIDCKVDELPNALKTVESAAQRVLKPFYDNLRSVLKVKKKIESHLLVSKKTKYCSANRRWCNNH